MMTLIPPLMKGGGLSVPIEVHYPRSITNRSQHLKDKSCLLSDGVCDIITIGQNWTILTRKSTGKISMHGASAAFGSVDMDLVSAVTVVDSVKGPVLVRAQQAIAPVENNEANLELESLLNPHQLREQGLIVDDTCQAHGGSQCILIPQEDESHVILPFTFVNGNAIMYNRLPSTEELEDLPMYDLTPSADDDWEPKDFPTIEFDMSKVKLPDSTQNYTSYRKKVTKGTFTHRNLKKWAQRLSCPKLNVVRQKLRATTKYAIQEHSSFGPIKSHMKRRFYAFKHRRLNNEVHNDTIVARKDG